MTQNQRPPGRPQDKRVTNALFEVTVHALARYGYDKTTVALVAARAGTSKQAVYRRYKDKSDLIAAAVQNQLARINVPPPQRASVAEDLRRCLFAIADVLHTTPLGGAMRALLPHRENTAIKAVLEDAETSNRLLLRQIFIATPFEAKMETRIDLLLGFISFRLFLQKSRIADDDIETAIYLVLGLVAPRDPIPNDGMRNRR